MGPRLNFGWETFALPRPSTRRKVRCTAITFLSAPVMAATIAGRF
jgi:hypothetical protein